MFDIRDESNFREAINDIESELVLRRMIALGETQGTNAQLEILKEVCQERWPIGGTQRTVREMMTAADAIDAQRAW